MALTDCNLVTDEFIDCRSSLGGIKKIYVTEFQNITSVTSSSGTITAIGRVSGKKFWVYELEKENAEISEVANVSVENGTVFYETTLSFTLKKMSAQKRNNLALLAQNRLAIIEEDNNGVHWLMGETRGADMTVGEAKSGKAFGDLNGYNLTFVAKEPSRMKEVTSGIVSALTSA